MLVGLGEEATGSSGRVVDGFTNFGVNDLDDGADDLTWSEELSAVVVFLAHLEE